VACLALARASGNAYGDGPTIYAPLTATPETLAHYEASEPYIVGPSLAGGLQAAGLQAVSATLR